MPLVLLERFNNGLDAGVAQSVLSAAGIESVIFDLEMNWGGLDGVVPVRLMVLDEDFADARAALNGETDD